MAAVINKFRLSQGWAMLPVSDAEKMVGVWIEVLDRHAIPAQAYEILYTAALDVRARRQAEGRDVPDFNATFLASLWLSDRSLRVGATQDAKQLETTLKCGLCNGTGWKPVMSDKYSTVVRCDHKETTDGK